jgi:hypothetical protein
MMGPPKESPVARNAAPMIKTTALSHTLDLNALLNSAIKAGKRGRP